MEWEAIRDNLGLVVFAAVWLLSILARAVRSRRTGRRRGAATRGRLRRRAILIGLVLMVAAVAMWNVSGDLGGSEASLLRGAALALAGFAVLAMLVAGFARSGSSVQAEISFEPPEERAAEIRRAEPLEPR